MERVGLNVDVPGMRAAGPRPGGGRGASDDAAADGTYQVAVGFSTDRLHPQGWFDGPSVSAVRRMIRTYFAAEVREAFTAINAALDTVARLELSGLDPGDLLQLAALTEKSIRRHTVVSHDASYQLGQRKVGEIGGSAGRELADWLRISPAEAQRIVLHARDRGCTAPGCTRGDQLPPHRTLPARSGGTVTRFSWWCPPPALWRCRPRPPRPGAGSAGRGSGPG
jgi:hypothetical protein